MDEMKCKINMVWDPDVSVWTAVSDDVPGLVLESGSRDGLLEKVRRAVPELLELNGVFPESVSLSFTDEEDPGFVYEYATVLESLRLAHEEKIYSHEEAWECIGGVKDG